MYKLNFINRIPFFPDFCHVGRVLAWMPPLPNWPLVTRFLLPSVPGHPNYPTVPASLAQSQ